MSFCRNCGSRLQASAAPIAAHPPPAQPEPAQPEPAQPQSAASMHICPHCSAPTPTGFSFCQQCGRKLPSAPSRDVGPGTERRPLVVSGETGGPAPGPVDAVGPTLAAGQSPHGLRDAAAAGVTGDAYPTERTRTPSPTPPPGAHIDPQISPQVRPQIKPGLAGPDSTWGVLVSINRDGSDGQPYPLSGEWLEIGRDRADVTFPDDRFLAPRHARIERSPSGARIVPLDDLNGVFVRIAQPTPLSDGDVLLFGREVVRFELVTAEEREAKPLVRYGVALFGSPPREPWGRLLQLLASGGVRDIRHLSAPAVTVGREEGDIVFRDDQFMSRRHATFSWRDGACFIEDLKSSNGTFIHLLGPAPLPSGTFVRLGDQVFRFEINA